MRLAVVQAALRLLRSLLASTEHRKAVSSFRSSSCDEELAFPTEVTVRENGPGAGGKITRTLQYYTSHLGSLGIISPSSLLANATVATGEDKGIRQPCAGGC